MDIRNKHIVVFGAARSGMAIAMWLNSQGASVFVSDYGKISQEKKDQLQEHGIPFEESGHSPKALEGDFAVLSPGVPTQAPPVQAYLENGKPVYSEIEVASWFTARPIVGVTGTNGKTTVTQWLDHLWSTAKRDHVAAGNIGNAFSDTLYNLKENTDILLEISSFQLDHIDRFRPHIGVLLNITPDHLDRYQGSFEHYARSKFRIAENQNQDDVLIYNYEDSTLKAFAEKLAAKDNAPHLLAFSDRQEVPQGAFVQDRQIMFKFGDQTEVLMPEEEVSLRGNHNLRNSLATALAARASEITNDPIRESLKSFEGVEHRLELIRVLDDVKYINDSKATNINSVWYALDSIHEPTTLILGGRDKGNDYSAIEPLIRERVHSLIAIGEARPKIREQLADSVDDFFEAGSMMEAVRLAHKQARKHEVVLLSPACSSFDMYDNYEHRGRVFRECVNRL